MKLLEGALVTATVIVLRIAWVLPLTYLPRALSRRLRAASPAQPWQETVIVAWTGIRGAVSLAAALALPFAIDTGGAFPERERIIFLVFSVILGTLLLQGLTLPALISRLGLDDADEELELEEIEARLRVADAALGASRRAPVTASSTAGSAATASTTRPVRRRTSAWSGS